MKRALISAFLLLAIVGPAFGWGRDGHRLIGDAASKLLTRKARAHVVAILGNADLGAAANWADDVRSANVDKGPLAGDPEAVKVNREFPENGRWHFVDLPLGVTDYAQANQLGFDTGDDVVHAIDTCIAVLDGTAPKSTSPSLTQAEALKFLVHFVGDIHQPLHVGCGYYQIDADKTVHLIADPNTARTLVNDRGGNDLFFGKGKHDELHALWDVDLVTGYENKPKRPKARTRILRLIDAAAWADSGDYHDWASRWAVDTLGQSRNAYHGVTFGKAVFDKSGKLKRINIKMNLSAYKAANEPIVGEQLAKASFRLAELLNHIWQ